MNSLKIKVVKAFALAFMISFLTINFSSCYILFPDKDETTENVESTDESENKTTDENKAEEKKSEETKKNETKQEEEKPSSFTVSFSTDGGTTIDSQTVAIGAKATKPATDPTKSGCTFGGWYTSSDFATAFDFNTAITENTTIYAKWTIAEGYFGVTFNANGGTPATTNVVVATGELVTRPAKDPEKADGFFAGWYSDAECTNAFDFENTTITQETTIYAKWNPAGIGKIELKQQETGKVMVTKTSSGYTFTATPETPGNYKYSFYLYGQTILGAEWFLPHTSDYVINSPYVAENLSTNNWTYTGNLQTDKDYLIIIVIFNNNTCTDVLQLNFKG